MSSKYSYPRVELHLHLDGAMPDRLFLKWCHEDGLMPDGISDARWLEMHRLKDALSLQNALKNFDLLLALLNSRQRLSECTYELLKDLYSENIRLAEIRFAPQSHKTMSMEEAVEAVVDGRNRFAAEYPDSVSGILLCMMHSSEDNHIENTRTVELAAKYKDRGVVGIDLAGNENGNPLSEYKPQFDLAARLHVPFTAHAGESSPASNVQYMIDLGAERIGHGVNAIQDMAVVKSLADHHVTLEISPTSNIVASAFPSMKDHPVRKLFDAGVRMNINTDDPFLLEINLDHEYNVLRTMFHFSEKELILTNLYGAEASFCTGKEQIIHQLQKALVKAEGETINE